MNIHNPERQPGESTEAYRERRAAGQRAVKAMTNTPKQSRAISEFDVERFFVGQHENKQRNARRGFVAEYGNRQARKARHAMVIGELWNGTPLDSGQHPKFAKSRAKSRKHAQHKHPLRDGHGAYTVVGRDAETNTGRRMWVAGISAQRGY